MKRAPYLLRALPLLSLAGWLAACAPLPPAATASAGAGGSSASATAEPVGAVRPAAAADDGRPQRFTLANGMTLIVQPDRRAPTAVQMVWVRVGAYDESDGWTGVAHALEHMMFKGTPSLPPGEFSRRVAALGGRENAFTSQDYTGYYQQIPAGRLEEVMRIESDRFAHNQWPDDEFKREIEVIKEERRMRTDDNPRSRLYEVLQATTFVAAPYRRPVIGWPGDLDTMTADDVRDFHRRWYRPANAAVVVAGDVDVATVRRLAETYYGAIPAGALPARKPRTEPVQAGIRRAEVKAPAEQAYVALNFKVPRLSADTGLDRATATPADDDALALTVLSAVLDGYPGARLDRALTQGPDRVADSVNASHDLIGRGPSLFGLQGVPARGKTAAQVEAGLRAEVARVARDGVTAAELERVKTQWRAGEVYKRDSVFGLANELGSDWVQGLPLDASERLIARLQDITPARVRAVAAQYFGDDQLTVATLLPQPRAAGDAPVRPPAAAAGGALR